jgi:hypothetical protein
MQAVADGGLAAPNATCDGDLHYSEVMNLYTPYRKTANTSAPQTHITSSGCMSYGLPTKNITAVIQIANTDLFMVFLLIWHQLDAWIVVDVCDEPYGKDQRP